MRPFRLRSNLKRAVIGGFALPLGFVARRLKAPTQGYTLDYIPGGDEEPDTYSFHIVVSHERIAPILDCLFDLLPEEVFGIVEIGSRDAYRSLDVYMSQEPLLREEFRQGWMHYEPFLLEDGSIAAGANSEDPFIEVFLDQWKGISVHVPLLMRGRIEALLAEAGLREVPETWPAMNDETAERAMKIRTVLATIDDFSPDIDEMLLQFRHVWKLELNVDPETNVDDGGRSLGCTLWHALVIVESVEDPEGGAYASIWASADSLGAMEEMTGRALESYSQWRFIEMYTIDRVAYDERPEELADLPPRPTVAKVHLVSFEPWPAAGAEGDGGDSGEHGRG